MTIFGTTVKMPAMTRRAWLRLYRLERRNGLDRSTAKYVVLGAMFTHLGPVDRGQIRSVA